MNSTGFTVKQSRYSSSSTAVNITLDRDRTLLAGVLPALGQVADALPPFLSTRNGQRCPAVSSFQPETHAWRPHLESNQKHLFKVPHWGCHGKPGKSAFLPRTSDRTQAAVASKETTTRVPFTHLCVAARFAKQMLGLCTSTPCIQTSRQAQTAVPARWSPCPGCGQVARRERFPSLLTRGPM